eukprot:365018-Chlamydomonas_euryale.AAC.16
MSACPQVWKHKEPWDAKDSILSAHAFTGMPDQAMLRRICAAACTRCTGIIMDGASETVCKSIRQFS